MRILFAVIQLLLAVFSVQTVSVPTLKVVFAMKKKGYGDTILPAVLAPIQKIKTDFKVDVNWTFLETNNQPTGVAAKFFSTIDHFQPHAIIGEADNKCCEVMGTLASAIDTLYISVDCSPFQFIVDRASYPTYAAPRTSVASQGWIVDKVMEKFSWKRVALITSPEGDYPARFRNVKEQLKMKKREFFSYTFTKSGSSYEEFLMRSEATRIALKHLADRATLFVLLLANSETQLLLKFAAEIGLMDKRHAFLVHGLRGGFGVTGGLTSYNGILSEDRTWDSDTPEWRNFVSELRSGFDNDDWKNRVGWKRPSDFDDQTSSQNRKLLSAGYLNDAVLLWRNVLEEAKKRTPTVSYDAVAKPGEPLSSLARSIHVEGVTGTFTMKDGIRPSNWTVSIVRDGKLIPIFMYDDHTAAVTDMNPGPFVWAGGSTTAPKDPSCFVDQCPPDDSKHTTLVIICCSLLGVIVVIIIAAFSISMVWKRLREKHVISNWRILWTDVALMTDANTNASNSIWERRSIGRSIANSAYGHLYISAGFYKGRAIAIKKIQRDSANIFDMSLYNELKQLLRVKHENINAFVGVCVDAPNVCVAMAYAEKGSIQNVLADSQFNIDWEFRMSLALDVANGMEYLHGTPVGAHGHLTSANCVIDERWVCKITDYGLKLFRCIPTLQRPPLDLLWTAPEILRKKSTDALRFSGTKPGDVYSFGIILSELLTRELPYQSELRSTTFEELLTKVKLTVEPPFRPHLPETEGHISGEWIALARNCWQKVPQKRPTFRAVKSALLANHSGKFTNVLERKQMMLEESIELANADLLVERRRTEAMLENILPSQVVRKISSGAGFEPQLTDSVTLCLCDTIGFGKATNDLPADVVVEILEVMYRHYDEISEKYGALEINTSGGRDMMMLAGGLPVNANVDAEAICTMALELLSFISTFKHPSIEGKEIHMKTTIHTGSAYSAVMGKEIPHFHVFGDVIPSTTHLHSVGSDMTIRISSTTRDLLPTSSGFKIQKADKVMYKDNLVTMYFVTGKKEFTKPLPTAAPPVPGLKRRSTRVKRKDSARKTSQL